MIETSRAERACTDVVAVEETAPGLVEVVTFGGAYMVDARGDGCHCPDKAYNEVPICKHEAAALLATSADLPNPFIVDTDLNQRQVATDGGQVVTDDTLESFDELHYGDEIEYVGPDAFDSPHVAPKESKQPYTFQHVSLHGTLSCLTKFNGPKRLAREHPANDPQYWRKR